MNALRKELYILGKVAAVLEDEDISTARTILYWFARDGQDDKAGSEQATEMSESEQEKRERDEQLEQEMRKRYEGRYPPKFPNSDSHDSSAPFESTADSGARSESTVILESSGRSEAVVDEELNAHMKILRNTIREQRARKHAGRTPDGRLKGKAREEGPSVTHSVYQFFDPRARNDSPGFDSSESMEAGNDDNSYRCRILGDRPNAIPLHHGLSGISGSHFQRRLGSPSERPSLGSGTCHTTSTRNSGLRTPTYLSIYHGPQFNKPGFVQEGGMTSGPAGTTSWSSSTPLSRWDPESTFGPPDWNPPQGRGSWQPVLGSTLIRNPIDGSLRHSAFRWVPASPSSDTL